MGSQASSNFIGIEALCLNFSSLIFMRAFVICSVKATFIALSLGLLESFCKRIITLEILQPSRSKSILSFKVVELLSPIFLKFLAFLLEKVPLGLGNVAKGMGTLGGLLASTLLVLVMVQTLVILLFLEISSSLYHLACNSSNILTFSSILTCMELVAAKGFAMVLGLADILLIKEDCASDKDEIFF